MNNMKKPKIRFKGFTDDWEQRKFGDVFEEYSEKNHEDLPPLTIVQGSGTIPREESGRDIKYDKSSLNNYKLVNPGDFILHLRSFEGGLEVANSQGIVSPAYHIFRGIRTDSRFYYPFFRSHDFINILLKPHVYGIRDGKSIDVEGMKSIKIPYPDFDEQKRIGDFFDHLDNAITLHQSKAESWKNKENQLSTISWEQRKVGDITIESTEYTTLDAGYPLLTSSRAGLMYQNEYRGNLTTDSKETLFSVVPIGACTYRHMSDDDVFHLNINTLEKGLVSREYPVFFATKENCLNFIIQYINSSASFRAFCAEQKKGGTRTRLYYNALCEFKMMVPSKREQEVIAGYFLSLDHLITLHHRKLNRTQICINRSFIYGSF